MKYRPYSWSKLSKFQCPHAWKLEYLDMIKPPTTLIQKLGSVAHCVVEVYTKDLIARNIREDRELLDLLIREYAELEGLPELFEFQFKIPPLPEYEYCHVEKWIAVDAKARPVDFNSPEAILRGRLDLVYQTPCQASVNEVTIVDWKSHLSSPDMRQLGFYGILSAFETKAEAFEMVIISLKDGRKFSRKLFRNELRPVWEWALATIDKIETEKEWAPTPGPHCKWCGYLGMGLCPVSKEVPVPTDTRDPLESVEFPKIDFPKTPDEARKLAALLKIVDVLRDRLRESLRPWCSEHGPVKINKEAKEAFGIWEKETIVWKTPESKQKLAQLLLEEVPREKVWEVFSVDKKKLYSFLSTLRKEKKEHLLSEIEALGEKTVSSRLEWKSLN